MRMRAPKVAPTAMPIMTPRDSGVGAGSEVGSLVAAGSLFTNVGSGVAFAVADSVVVTDEASVFAESFFVSSLACTVVYNDISRVSEFKLSAQTWSSTNDVGVFDLVGPVPTVEARLVGIGGLNGEPALGVFVDPVQRDRYGAIVARYGSLGLFYNPYQRKV